MVMLNASALLCSAHSFLPHMRLYGHQIETSLEFWPTVKLW